MLCTLLLPQRSDLSFLLLPQAPELHAQLHAQMRAQQEEGEVTHWHITECHVYTSSRMHLQASDFDACDLLPHAQASTLELCASDTLYNSQTKRRMAYTCGLLLVDTLKALLGLLLYVQVQLLFVRQDLLFWPRGVSDLDK